MAPSPGPIGPGFTITLTSSLPALPVGGAWEHLFTSSSRDAFPNFARESISVPITSSDPFQVIMTLPKSSVTETTNLNVDESLLISSTIVDLNNITQDQGQWPAGYHWDPTTGLQNLQVPAQGGLTQQEHTWLDQTQTAVNPIFQALTGAILSTPIGGLIAHPDTHLMNQLDPCLTLVGNGTAVPPQNPALSLVYGMVINFETIPRGFGFVKGIENTYSTRIAQFGAVYATLDGAHQYLGEVHDVYRNNTQWLWSTFTPLAIVYSITPGCAVNACWLAA